MENKYYTPTIEEFHVGFECEVYGFNPNNRLNNNFGKKWEKITFSIEDINLLKDKYLDSFRVKYLDREDIESLGWTSDDNKTVYYKGNHMLLYREEEHEISIAIADPSKDKDMMISLRSNEVYKITIKNKSELKRLLKQLRINENN